MTEYLHHMRYNGTMTWTLGRESYTVKNIIIIRRTDELAQDSFAFSFVWEDNVGKFIYSAIIYENLTYDVLSYHSGHKQMLTLDNISLFVNTSTMDISGRWVENGYDYHFVLKGKKM